MKSLGDRIAERERRNELLREMGSRTSTVLESKGYYWKPLGYPEQGRWTTQESEALTALLLSMTPDERMALYREGRKKEQETKGGEWGLVLRADEDNRAVGMRYDLFEDVS